MLMAGAGSRVAPSRLAASDTLKPRRSATGTAEAVGPLAAPVKIKAAITWVILSGSVPSRRRDAG
jgi:hypothetical protein